VVFHGCYDFGYLLRELRGEPLPKSAEECYKSIRIYFPHIYDLKHILREEHELNRGGLNGVAAKIGVCYV
jgi:CCR4-NOT transcription complex subunit 7/8